MRVVVVDAGTATVVVVGGSWHSVAFGLSAQAPSAALRHAFLHCRLARPFNAAHTSVRHCLMSATQSCLHFFFARASGGAVSSAPPQSSTTTICPYVESVIVRPFLPRIVKHYGPP